MPIYKHDVFVRVVIVVYHWKAIGIEILFAALFFILMYIYRHTVAMVTNEESIFCQYFGGFSPKNANFECEF